MMARLSLIVGCVFLTASLLSSAEIDRTFYWSDEEIYRFYGAAASDRGAAAQHASLQRLWDMARDSGQKAPDQLIPHLGEGLRKLSRQNIFQVRERIEVYDFVQSTLLSIPGHARYFADEIKREQREVAKYPTNTGPRVSYDRTRGWYLQTLSHLPSAETISVLGEFLSDDIDTPLRLMDPGSDWGENPRANSFGASFVITAIGLREAPASKDSYDADPEAHLAKTRAWWEEVKSGQRTFSFKGQAVEYRFKPDGTWDTIPIANPPDDGPKEAGASAGERPIKRLAPASQTAQESPRDVSWWWYAVIGSALLALVAWFWSRNRSA